MILETWSNATYQINQIRLFSGWRWSAKISTKKNLERMRAFPPALNPLHERMIDQVCNPEDAGLCKGVLVVISAVYQLITLDEIEVFVDMPDSDSGCHENLKEIVALCCSFLTLKDRTIFFIHQPAKDYLLKQAVDRIFPSRIEAIHYSIFSSTTPCVVLNHTQKLHFLERFWYGILCIISVFTAGICSSQCIVAGWAKTLTSNCLERHHLWLPNVGVVMAIIGVRGMLFLDSHSRILEVASIPSYRLLIVRIKNKLLCTGCMRG